MSLKCTVVKPNGKPCGHEMYAMTGLRELNKLMAHMKRAHRNTLGIYTLAELRVKMENGEPIYCKRGGENDG